MSSAIIHQLLDAEVTLITSRRRADWRSGARFRNRVPGRQSSSNWGRLVGVQETFPLYKRSKIGVEPQFRTGRRRSGLVFGVQTNWTSDAMLKVTLMLLAVVALGYCYPSPWSGFPYAGYPYGYWGDVWRDPYYSHPAPPVYAARMVFYGEFPGKLDAHRKILKIFF